jgi:haloalkane dehalogenase
MQALIVQRNLFVERILRRSVNGHGSEDVMAHYRGPLATPSARAGVAVLPRQILGASFWLDEIAYAVPRVLGRVPLLLTWGVDDRAFPARFIKRFTRDFANVTVRRIRAGHFVPEEAPGDVADAIEEFLSAPGGVATAPATAATAAPVGAAAAATPAPAATAA